MDKVKFCCDVFPKLAKLFSWFSYTNDNGVRIQCMPSLLDSYDTDGRPHYFRVDHCPSCGEYVRSIEVPDEQYKEITNS